MATRVASVMAALLCLVAGCKAVPSPITLRVIDAKSGEPLPDVEVSRVRVVETRWKPFWGTSETTRSDRLGKTSQDGTLGDVHFLGDDKLELHHKNYVDARVEPRRGKVLVGSQWGEDATLIPAKANDVIVVPMRVGDDPLTSLGKLLLKSVVDAAAADISKQIASSRPLTPEEKARLGGLIAEEFKTPIRQAPSTQWNDFMESLSATTRTTGPSSLPSTQSDR